MSLFREIVGRGRECLESKCPWREIVRRVSEYGV